MELDNPPLGPSSMHMELEERLKLIRAERELLLLEHIEPDRAIQLQIARINVEEAKLEPQLRSLIESWQNATAPVLADFVNGDAWLEMAASGSLDNLPDLSMPLLSWDGAPQLSVQPNFYHRTAPVDVFEILMNDFNPTPGDASCTPRIEFLPMKGDFQAAQGAPDAWKAAQSHLEDVSFQASTSGFCGPLPALSGPCELAGLFMRSWNPEMTYGGLQDPNSFSPLESEPIRNTPAATTAMLPVQNLREVTTLSTPTHQTRGNKRRSREDDIPGTACFHSRPPVKRTRRAATEDEQRTINSLRLRGACLPCRLKNIKCSEGNPCGPCEAATTARQSLLGSSILSSCLRSFSDVDPFSHLRSTALKYLSSDCHWPQWNWEATGRPRHYVSQKSLQALTVFNLMHTTMPGAHKTFVAPGPSTWSSSASELILLLDRTLKRTTAWQHKRQAVILVATLDLLMSVLLDMALHVRHVKEQDILHERPHVFEQLVERCVFCTEKVLSFRAHVLRRLGMNGSEYFAESALCLLQSIQNGYPPVEQFILSLEAASQQGDTSQSSSGRLSSRIVLFQQVVRLRVPSLACCVLAAEDHSERAAGTSGNRSDTLHWAVIGNQLQLVGLLLDSGADVESQDAQGCTALELAIQFLNADMVTLLLKRGASPLLADWSADTQQISRHPRSLSETIMMRIHVSEQMSDPLMAGWIVNLRDRNTDTALHLAVRIGRQDLTEMLIRQGADLNLQTALGESPLHTGVCTGRPALGAAKALVRAGARIDLSDSQGQTALHRAILRGATDMVSLLINAGPSVNLDAPMPGNSERDTALHVAVRGGHVGILSSIVVAGAALDVVNGRSQTGLHLATKHGNEKLVSILVNAGASLSLADTEGRTPLHLAALEGHTSLVSMLIEARADLDVDDQYQQTALHLAASHAHPDIVSLLLKANAAVDCVDLRGQTALHLAVKETTYDAVHALLGAGADVNIADNKRRTPLHLAASMGNPKVVSGLLAAGANPDSLCVDLLSPLQHAVRSKVSEIGDRFSPADQSRTYGLFCRDETQPGSAAELASGLPMNMTLRILMTSCRDEWILTACQTVLDADHGSFGLIMDLPEWTRSGQREVSYQACFIKLVEPFRG